MAAALGLSGCGLKNDSLAGGTTTETEALILGTITRQDGALAAGARVRIRPVDYLSDNRTDSAAYGDVIADAQGRFRWVAKDQGPFNLEASQGGTLGALIRDISPGKESRELAGVLDTVGALRLNLLAPIPGVVYILRVTGMERYVEADALGSFQVSLPAGNYRLVLTGGTSDVTPLVIDDALVERGKVRVLDSLRFPRLDSALLGYWPLEEGSGESIGDKSGNGYFGSMKGAKWVAGKVGGAIQFNQGQGYVDLGVPNPDPFAFDAGMDFSYMAWVKVGNTIPNRGVARRIISKQKNGSYASFLRIFPGGHPGFGVNLPKTLPKGSAAVAATVRDLIAPVNVGDGGWHHIAGIFRQGRLSIYVDGKLAASALSDSLKSVSTFTDYNDHSPLLYPDPGTDGHLVLGCVNSGVDGFDGMMDEVRIYARALAPAEILQLADPLPLPLPRPLP